MAYTQTGEEARIIVNFDFSLVVPGGTFYDTNEEDLPENPNSLPEGAKLTLDFAKPKPLNVGTDFSNPIARGVIKNYVAGLFIDRYGTDVKQESAFETKHAAAVYGLKTNRLGAGYFVVVTERGIYEGKAIIPGMPSKQRLALLKSILGTLTRYESTPSEIDAALHQKEKAIQEEERERRFREEAAARRAAQEEQRREQETGIGAAAETTAESKETASAGIAESVGAAASTGESTGVETEPKPAQTESAEAKADRSEMAEESTEAFTEPEAVKEEPAEPEAESKAAQGNSAVAESESEAEQAEPSEPEAESEAEPEEELTPEEKHIRELEEKRRQHLDEMRARFAGNPEVEGGIDNYIARVDHTGDEIVRTFRKFLSSVQQYAASAQFTSEEDPAYVEMISGIREEEKGLGRKLDDLTQSVDTNVTDAVTAGITESFVERMIRMVERIGTRYEQLAVSMNGQDRIAYEKKDEVAAIITKWQNFRQNLPSHLAETDKKKELETSSRIQKRIKEQRGSLLSRQQAVSDAEESLKAATEELRDHQQEVDEFEAGYEDRKSAIEKEQQDRITANAEAARTLQQELEDNRTKMEELEQELSRTFALNMNKKKTLSNQINELTHTIADEEQRLAQLDAAAAGFADDAKDKLTRLENDRAQLQEKLSELKANQSDLGAALEKAEKDLQQHREDLAASEEEWKHVHENYLMGKYD